MNDAVRAVPMQLGGQPTWTVVDKRGVPIEVVDSYLHYLRSTDRSPNTVRSYARHLSLLFRWLDAHALPWDEVDFELLCDFMYVARLGQPPLQRSDLRGERSISTMRAIAAALREFYEHHRLNGDGPSDLRLSREQAHSTRTNRHFLAHIEARRPVEHNRLLPRGPAAPPLPDIIAFEDDFTALLSQARTGRDALLLSLLYDLGLRVGAVLGLRHGDLDPMRRRVTVTRRQNVNGSLTKRRDSFTVEAPTRTFDLYAKYLLEELEPAGIDSDYLLVNLRPGAHLGRACTANNIGQVVSAIGQRAGLPGLHPHTLRHTHATALAKAGWTSAEIAARLGQTHSSSADVYIHLASEDLSAKLAATEHLIWRPLRTEEASA